jgi:lysozyme
MNDEHKYLLGAGVLAVGGIGAYWLYLYLQDTSNAPSLSEVFDNLKSYFSRGTAIASGAVGDLTGTSTYIDKATALVAKLEGFSAKTYNDQGKLAIGYGHDIRQGDPYDSSSVISESEAFALLKQDLQSADDCIAQNVQVALSDNQRAALISFVYNVGCGAFASSTMLRDLNAGDFQSAAAQFNRWVYAGQVVLPVLQSRRQTEQELFLA